MESLIKKGIYDVGVQDWNIRDFHGYSTEKGTSYNAFLIVDEKIVLVDTVKKEFSDQLIRNISKIVDPAKIDYVISNHTEMDHSGSIPRIMHIIGKDKPVYCSKLGEKALVAHFGDSFNFKAVENGEELNIGKRDLIFLETRMLHWPDSMFTYVKQDKVLFSSDAFGQHYAGFEKFDDQISDSVLMPHAKKYFANILTPFSQKILKLISDVKALNLEIDVICPDHGIYFRENPLGIIEKYAKWAEQKPSHKALVIYDTMWNSTESMALAICDGITSTGVNAVPMHARKWHRSDIQTEVLDAKALVFGSPTLNNGIFPTMADVITYLKGLKPKNKIGAAFGSFGWSGEAVKLLNADLTNMKVDLINEGLRMKYVPDHKVISQCVEFGVEIGNAVKES